ncbi:putative RTA1-like protein [Planoprotostelium fungivorum]|uniref:Putative RTA1-like protein n=1 Tax=Planoprotostelium fungivorum TaxID=1890364 RepID=A0A2P6NJE4_9EUKA|nr:putative RTA1-like protein [Planoprotostelium fungivorum]
MSDINEYVALYNPNGAASLTAFFVFGAVAIAYWIRFFREERPRPRWMLAVITATCFMSLGFICRFSRRNGISAWSWLFETLFILISPCGLLAQDYVLLPRLASSLEANQYLILPQRAILAIFVTADAITVCSQLAGTALTITFGDLVPIGVKIVISGLWVQLVFFSAFLTTFIMFGARVCNWKENKSEPWNQRPRTLYLALCVSCACMMIRSIYRIAEYMSGGNSKLAHSEIAFYTMDTLMVLINVLVFVVVWPPYCLQSKYIIDKHTTLPLED